MKPPTDGFSFELVATDGHARRGVFRTPHGPVDTPAFMPVGTQASVKTLSPDEVASTGAQMVLANTYHLALRPGADAIGALGGLHSFTRWPGPMLTDSGGYQAYSLSARGTGAHSAGAAATAPAEAHGRRGSLAKQTEDGFTFKSHLDGSLFSLTPEAAVHIQGLLGADVQMQLDVCPSGQAPRSEVEHAVARTTRWARRALACDRPPHQALFGIVQGGCFADLRRAHASELGALAFDGLALGGFSVGEPPERMHEALRDLVPRLDPDRPRYLMGVGTPRDLVLAFGAGVDMLDCVLPTRNARNGQALTRSGPLVIKQARWRADPRPLDDRCACACCARGYSRAYLRHLYLAGEILCLRLLSLHNLHFYGSLASQARRAIEQGAFEPWAQSTLQCMQQKAAD